MIGVASSGVHSNGFSLVRKVLQQAGADQSTRYGPDQRRLIEDLLRPTQLYPALVQALLAATVPLYGWRTSPAVVCRKICRGACRMAARPA